MTIRRFASGGPWEDAVAYSRAVEVDGWLILSGCTGADLDTGEIPADVAGQCRNTLELIGRVLEEHSAGFSDVVRVRYILPDRTDFEPCWPWLREAFGEARPAATMIQAGLISPELKIEIEVTAKLPEGEYSP